MHGKNRKGQKDLINQKKASALLFRGIRSFCRFQLFPCILFAATVLAIRRGLTRQISRLQIFHNAPPPSTGRPQACSSVEVEYVVDESGMVEVQTARVVKTTNPQLAEAFMAILPAMRYQPAKLDGTPVRQIVSDGVALMSQVVASSKGSPPSSRGTSPPSRVPTTC